MTARPSSDAPALRPSGDAQGAPPLQPQEAQNRLKATLEALPDILFVLDRDKRILDFHAPHPELLYVPPGQFLGRTMEEVLPSSAAAILTGALDKALAEGRHRGSVYSLPSPDGPRWFGASIATQGDLKSPEVRLVVIVHDITERKRTEEALRVSEARFDQIAQQSRTVVWEIDADGIFTFVSHVVEDVLGYRPEELVGKRHFYDLHPAENREAIRKAMGDVFRRKGAIVNYESMGLAKDGHPVWVVTNGIPLLNDDGALRGYRGSNMDITSRKRIERALKQATGELDRRVKERTAELEDSRQALAKSEAQFREMAENIQEVFWLIDAQERKLLYASPAFKRIWGQSPAGVPSLSEWLESVHPDDRKRVVANFERGLETGEPTHMGYRILRPDGSVRWIEDHGWAIRDETGRLSRIAGVIRDITDWRRLEAEILNAAEAERLRIGRDLHDSLGQTLTGIGYMAEAVREALARRSLPEAAAVEKLGGLIGQAAAHAHAMARGLLLVDLKRGGLASALQELAFRTQELFGVACRYEGPAEAVGVEADVAIHLYRIAQEAATNAAKHSQGETIVLHLSHERGGLLLSIRDTGKGLPREKGQADGMGRDIMRYRAGIIGATFWIDSEPGKGTAVNCLLARAAPPPETTP